MMRKSVFVIALFAILCVGIFFRVWQLSEIPPGVYMDEAAYGNDAIEVMQTHNYDAFYFDNYGREGMFINVLSVVFDWFGVGVWQLRIVGALAGVLTVLGVYFLCREMFQRPAALLAAYFLSTSFWFVFYNRIAYRANLAPLFIVWAFFLLLRAVRVRSAWAFLWFGVVFGLGFYTYIAYRMTIVVVAALCCFLLWEYWKEKKGKVKWRDAFIHDGWWKWIMAASISFLLLVPLLLIFFEQPKKFLMRSVMVSVFDMPSPILATLGNIVKTLGMFFVHGDPQWRHNIAGQPMLFWPIALCFAVGLVVLLSRRLSASVSIANAHRFFLLVWFGALTFPALLSGDHVPYALRTIGAIPVVYIIAAIGGWWFYCFVVMRARFSRTLHGIGVLFLVAIPVMTFERYFYYWAPHPEASFAFVEHHATLAKKLNALPGEQRKYVVVDLPGNKVDGLPIVAQSLIFLTHGTENMFFLSEEEARQTHFGKNDFVVSLLEYEKAYRQVIGKSMSD